MTVHVLRVDPPYMESLLDGTKRFEVRRNDRGFQAGDALELHEKDPNRCDCGGSPDAVGSGFCSTPQNRKAATTVQYVYAGDPRFSGHGGLQTGWVVLGLGAVTEVL